MHQVVFDPDDDAATILARADRQKTTLMAFFEACATIQTASQYTYQEFPQHFVWNKNSKKWTIRKKGFAIGRIYFADPSAGERFYLRLLLINVRGPQSGSQLRSLFAILLTQCAPTLPENLWTRF
ncbi:1030_t:CDS:2, partial [Cetraspora pellucida]